MVKFAIIVAALLLPGCSTTITDDEGAVTVKTTAPALLVSMDKVVQNAHRIAKEVCTTEGKAKVLSVDNQLQRRFRQLRPETLSLIDTSKETAEFFSTAKKAFDEGKSFLNSVFGTHGYAATVDCMSL